MIVPPYKSCFVSVDAPRRQLFEGTTLQSINNCTASACAKIEIYKLQIRKKAQNCGHAPRTLFAVLLGHGSKLTLSVFLLLLELVLKRKLSSVIVLGRL